MGTIKTDLSSYISLSSPHITPLTRAVKLKQHDCQDVAALWKIILFRDKDTRDNVEVCWE